MLEAWSLRNIFTFEPELPVLVPNQAGLNLHEEEVIELELMKENRRLAEKSGRRASSLLVLTHCPSS